MPYEDMIEDELMMMDEQLAEPSKSLKSMFLARITCLV